jgi:hypothetical protein
MARSDDDVSNVLGLDRRFTIRRIDGTSEERKHRICMPCHQIMAAG